MGRCKVIPVLSVILPRSELVRGKRDTGTEDPEGARLPLFYLLESLPSTIAARVNPGALLIRLRREGKVFLDSFRVPGWV